MRKKPAVDVDELPAEVVIDCSKAVRGKYAKRLKREGSNIVLLAPDPQPGA